MKVTEHVELLLRQGRKPKELVELGFSKTAVTRAKRQLKKEKATCPTAAPVQPVEVQKCAPVTVPNLENASKAQQRLESLEQTIQAMHERCDALETQVEKIKEFKVRVTGTPALGLKNRFTCSCGASGFVALHIQCTKCGRETWWGWFPD